MDFLFLYLKRQVGHFFFFFFLGRYQYPLVFTFYVYFLVKSCVFHAEMHPISQAISGLPDGHHGRLLSLLQSTKVLGTCFS